MELAKKNIPCFIEQLWTAPEILRLNSPVVDGSQKGDVYSIAIVLHEMIYRLGVFFLGDEEDMDPRGASVGHYCNAWCITPCV